MQGKKIHKSGAGNLSYGIASIAGVPTLAFEVDLSKNLGLSETGKSVILAKTEMFEDLEGMPGLYAQVLVGVRVPKSLRGTQFTMDDLAKALVEQGDAPVVQKPVKGQAIPTSSAKPTPQPQAAAPAPVVGSVPVGGKNGARIVTQPRL